MYSTLNQLQYKSRRRFVGNGFARKEHGVVAIVVALSMVVLIGFVGLALDLGKLFVTKTELQNSVDSCALAAARELTGANTNQLTLAEAAGIAAGTQNNALFQNESISFYEDSSVTFSDQLDGFYATKSAAANPLDMKFVRCTVERTGIANWFMQIFPGNKDETVNASAVASLVPGQTTCAIPAGICRADFNAASLGDWIEGALGPQGDMSGGFKWIDYTPPAGGASELNATLAGSGACSLPAVGSTVGEGGVISSLSKGWNSRFGIYKNVESDPGQSDFAVPDFSGFAYTEFNWPAQFDAFSDFATQRGSNAPYQGDALTGLKVEQGNPDIKQSGFLQQNGADRRLATVAVIDCPTLDAGAPTAPVEAWACVFMLHPINPSQGGSGTGSDRMFLEYQGRADDASSPCASSGMVGGPGSIGPLVPSLVQ